MLPTFRASGDLVVVDRISQRLLGRNYARGDVVIAWAPYDPEKMVCKRISAIAGDEVSIEQELIGRKVVENIIVPPGHVWLLGDNSANSNDSRKYGPGQPVTFEFYTLWS